MKPYSVTNQINAIEQSFHVVLFTMLYKVLFCLWVKSYCATIQMKAIEKQFQVVMFASIFWKTAI